SLFPLQPCDMQDGTGMISYACLATGFTPSALTYTWTVNDRPFADSIQYPPVLKNNFYTGVSQIQVRRQDWNNTQLYKCRVEHQGENREVIIKPAGKMNLIHISLLILLELTFYRSRPQTVKTMLPFSCLAKEFSPKTHEFKWLKNNQEITGNKHEITTTSEGKQVNGTTMYSAASFLTVASQDLERDAEYMCQFKGKESVTLTCYVKDFFPADILVSWLIDDEQLESNSEYEYNTTNPVENSGTYYAYAHLSVTADKWKETDTVYSCVVYHESVINTTKTIMLCCNSDQLKEGDNLQSTALTFILLFLITLVFTIGTTAFKVMRILKNKINKYVNNNAVELSA
uniref:Ig-like domain-containing protein n=1 Tax=Sphaeramia orbicularis TaxID=375764 RepID=A0A672YIQ5_9TELE